ncbi:MAG TPA: methyltransferase domain-containing protein [Candidatus Paceibacterota bacterium]|nr:methyltransferase domain-containing protein [Candidatus Paceibacterota bacterium]
MEGVPTAPAGFLDPREALRAIGIRAGSRVADIGAGTGAWALPLAKLVGEEGRVYCVDIQRDLIGTLANEARRRGLDTVEVIWGDADTPGGTKLSDRSVDLVIFANILFQLEAKGIALSEAQRILAPEGRLAIIEWEDSFGGVGPHKDDVVTRARAKELVADAGFAIDKEFSPGAHHYGLVCTHAA